MTLAEFKQSLSGTQPPDKLPLLLQALWFDAKGDWHASHNITQDVNTKDGAWIHAYLHRQEGDNGNAAYWYRRADKPVCTTSLQEEWDAIAAAILVQ